MKTFIVLAPISYDSSKLKELSDKAKKYYGEKDYSEYKVNDRTSNRIKDLMKDLITSNSKECNGLLFLIGVNAILTSQVDSVYFSKDWEKDDLCKCIHFLLFNHGVDIHYEPV